MCLARGLKLLLNAQAAMLPTPVQFLSGPITGVQLSLCGRLLLVTGWPQLPGSRSCLWSAHRNEHTFVQLA